MNRMRETGKKLKKLNIFSVIYFTTTKLLLSLHRGKGAFQELLHKNRRKKSNKNRKLWLRLI